MKMKRIVKKIEKRHEAPLFEVVMNKESNKKFFVASGGSGGSGAKSGSGSISVDAWDSVW